LTHDQIGHWLEQTKNQNFQALAKLLSWIERSSPKDILQHKELQNPPQKALRVGITGPPGSGKSTLIGALLSELQSREHFKVGVIAVDPSSPFSQGAILGDRIRYKDHFSNKNFFIRSLGSRGSLGGLSASAYLMLRAFDWAGFDLVLIETVGVGQTELEVMNVADLIAVVLVPESGDSIQAMKAGLLEVADLYLVNKADRPGSDGFVRELQASLGSHHINNTQAHILKTVATKAQGIEGFISYIDSNQASKNFQQYRNSAYRLKAEARALLRAQCEQDIEKKLKQIQSIQMLTELL